MQGLLHVVRHAIESRAHRDRLGGEQVAVVFEVEGDARERLHQPVVQFARDPAPLPHHGEVLEPLQERDMVERQRRIARVDREQLSIFLQLLLRHRRLQLEHPLDMRPGRQWHGDGVSACGVRCDRVRTDISGINRPCRAARSIAFRSTAPSPNDLPVIVRLYPNHQATRRPPGQPECRARDLLVDHIAIDGRAHREGVQRRDLLLEASDIPQLPLKVILPVPQGHDDAIEAHAHREQEAEAEERIPDMGVGERVLPGTIAAMMPARIATTRPVRRSSALASAKAAIRMTIER